MAIVRYLDPRNDVAFKKIFGTEKNKDILIHFLNDILIKSGDAPIKEVTFLNPALQPEIAAHKQSIIDVLCTDENGVMFIVEMQVSKVRGFEKRAQYYAAKAYSNQMKIGEEYHALKEVIFLAIVDFTMFPEKEGYKSDHVILDKKTYENDLKDFSFTFIELPKFKKDKVEELATYQEKWCYFFKHSHSPEDMQALLRDNDSIINKAYDALSVHNWNDAELNFYDAVTKADLDNKARESQVRLEGLEAGMEKGLAKGREEGREEGMAKGMEKGIKEGELRIAKAMLASGMPIEQVCQITGLSKDELS